MIKVVNPPQVLYYFNFVGPGFSIEGLHNTISNMDSVARRRVVMFKVLLALLIFFFILQRCLTRTLE